MARCLDKFAAVFRTPFAKLPFAVWCFFALGFVLHPQSRIRDLKFIDTDDYLYLAQAIDALKGQGWFDMIQHRMNPPDGTWIHFSHLLSGFYALVIRCLMPWMDMPQAGLITAIVCPLFFFGVLLALARWAAETFVGVEWARLTSVLILFLYALTFQFSPGRLDHHGLGAILALAAFGGAVRMMKASARLRVPILTGFLLALALMIGLEILPVLLVIAGVLGLWAVVEGAAAARKALVCAVSLFLSSVAFLFLTLAPTDMLVINLDAYSLAYVALTAGIAACFGMAFVTTRMLTNIMQRLVVNGVFTVLVAGVFILAFPALKEGPYGGADPAVVRLILRHALEAQPAYVGGLYTRSIFLPFLATLLAFTLAKSLRRDAAPVLRWRIVLLQSLLVVTLGLSIVYQQRFLVFAEAFSGIPLVFGLRKVWELTRYSTDRVSKWVVRGLMLLLIGPLTTVFFPVMGVPADNRAPWFFTDPIFNGACDTPEYVTVLTTRYGDHPRLIMNTMSPSAEILALTSHSVLASPFHMNTSGNLDAHAFFAATDFAAAKDILKRRAVDLVLLCKNIDSNYGDVTGGFSTAQAADARYVIQRLIDGDVPDWLTPVPDSDLKTFLLFEVKKDRL